MSNTLTRCAAALAMLATVAACSDSPVGPHSSGPAAAKGGPAVITSGGGASSDVMLGGSFTISGEGEWVVVGYRSSPQPAAAGGFCGDGSNGHALGTWVKPTPGTTSVHELHDHCTIFEWQESTVTVTFELAGTFVAPPNGNLLLNLEPLCENDVCVDRTVHYQKAQDATLGAGMLLGSGDDGSTWLLDLAQIDHAGNSRGDPNFDGISIRSYNGLTATKQGSSDSYDQVTLSW